MGTLILVVFALVIGWVGHMVYLDYKKPQPPKGPPPSIDAKGPPPSIDASRR